MWLSAPLYVIRRGVLGVKAWWRDRQLGRGAFATVRVDPDTDDDVEHGPNSAVDDAHSSGALVSEPVGSLPAAAVVTGDDRGLGAIDCVICMTEVVLADRDYMVTPCCHVFHEQCLRQWMDVKMECPTCRALLPSP